MVRLETQPALTLRTDCLDGTDACVTPVLEKDEAPSHPHNKARASFLPSGLPGPAPRLSRTPASASSGGDSLEWGAHTMEILAEEGYDQVNPPPSFFFTNVLLLPGHHTEAPPGESCSASGCPTEIVASGIIFDILIDF